MFAGFIFFLSWLLLGFLHSPKLTQYVGFDAGPFLQSVPVLVFALLFLGILFSSFGVLLQALYLSGDMDFLLTSPVPIRAVFVTKLLQAVLPNFGLAPCSACRYCIGLGLSGHYNLLYYPLVVLTMIALTLAAAGLSALLVMLVARIFPPRRVAEVLGFLTATLSILCSQSGNLYNTLGRNVTISGSQVNGVFALLMRFNTPWNPLNWAGRGLVDLGRRALAFRSAAGGGHPGARNVGLYRCPGHGRTLVLHRLGRDAGGEPQEKACPPCPGAGARRPARFQEREPSPARIKEGCCRPRCGPSSRRISCCSDGICATCRSWSPR